MKIRLAVFAGSAVILIGSGASVVFTAISLLAVYGLGMRDRAIGMRPIRAITRRNNDSIEG